MFRTLHAINVILLWVYGAVLVTHFGGLGLMTIQWTRPVSHGSSYKEVRSDPDPRTQAPPPTGCV